MKHVRQAFLLAAFLPLAAAAQPLEFKGVAFGSSLATFQADHNKFSCMPNPRDATITWCMVGPEICRIEKRLCGPHELDAAKFAGEATDSIKADFLDGNLERVNVYFDPQSFDAVRYALIARYGKPTSNVKALVQSVSGGKAVNTTVTWLPAGGAEIVLIRYPEKLTQSALFMVSKAWADSQARRDAAAAAARAKGM